MPKRPTATLVFMALFGSASTRVLAQTVTGPAPIATTAGGWARWRLGYSGLTFEVPARPNFNREVHGDEEINRATLTLEGGRVEYIAQAFPHDYSTIEGVDAAIRSAVSRLAQQIGGFVRSQSFISSGRYRGADVALDIPSQGRTAYVRVLIGRELAYFTTVVQATYESVDNAVRFNGSLQVDDGDAPDVEGDGVLSTTWAFVHPFGATFAIRMPGRPRRAEGQFTANGRTRPAMRYAVESPTESWQVIVVPVTERADSRAFASVVAPLTSAGWQVREQGPVNNQGFPGRAYLLVSPDGTSTTSLRVFLTNGNIFSVRATVPTADWRPRAAQVHDYFESLRIL